MGVDLLNHSARQCHGQLTRPCWLVARLVSAARRSGGGPTFLGLQLQWSMDTDGVVLRKLVDGVSKREMDGASARRGDAGARAAVAGARRKRRLYHGNDECESSVRAAIALHTS